jgi:intracellular sulfur oxidation DsrE/DsrF family protein
MNGGDPMHQLLKVAAIGAAGVAIGFALPNFAQLPTSSASTLRQSTWTKSHRVVIQVTQNDPAIMNLALNNAENLAKFYKDKGEPIQIEFVAYGPGLNMVRNDTSPVKERLAAMTGTMKNVTFTGCGNTLAAQSKQENRSISLFPEVHIVPAGIAHVVELEEQGWTYVRP